MKKETMNYEKFHAVLEQAKGLRTVRAFADECNISPEYMSRLMTENVRPCREVIEAISRHAYGNVSLKDLLEAAEYDVSEEKTDSKEVFIRQVRSHAMRADAKPDGGAYLIGLAAAKNDRQAVPALRGEKAAFEEYARLIARDANALCSFSPFSGEAFGEVITAGIGGREAAVCKMHFSYDTPQITQLMKCMALAEKSGKAYVMRLLTQEKDLAEFFPEALCPAAADEARDPYQMYSETQYKTPDDNETYGERILRLAGKPRYGKTIVIPALETGIGFYTDSISEASVLTALSRRRMSLPKGRSPLEFFADIMKTETGIPFGFSDADSDDEYSVCSREKFPDNRSQISADESVITGKFSRKTVLDACRRYAEELGAEYYGNVWLRYEAKVADMPDHKISGTEK